MALLNDNDQATVLWVLSCALQTLATANLLPDDPTLAQIAGAMSILQTSMNTQGFSGPLSLDAAAALSAALDANMQAAEDVLTAVSQDLPSV